MKTRYKSDLLAAIHETASGLADIGLMDKQTLKNLDKMCLRPAKPLSSDRIAQIRRQGHSD